MIKCLIIDDEQMAQQILEQYILQSDNLILVGKCRNALEAFSQLEQQVIDLIFLDIEMPNMNGFELIEKLPIINFDLVFTTSFDQYAIKAIKFSALDYLLKPVDREELKKAVQKSQAQLTSIKLDLQYSKKEQHALLAFLDLLQY